MSTEQRPLVSVVTPVYNGEHYLRECIESVLSQTYQNFEYIILDNCSDDKTFQIAEEYRLKDNRIRLYSNDTLLPIIANHNKAFDLICRESKYCKVVSADDWLLPECLARMVDLAEANPSIGVIGSYQLSGGEGLWYVRNYGLPYSTTVVAGSEICRIHLLGMLSVFGNPTSDMYRSDLVRSTSNFYPNATAEADVSACFQHLKNADFGFVHQVLSHERLHRVRVTTTSLETNAYLSAAISDCQTYGEWYLNRQERDFRLKVLLKSYYAYLSVSALKFRGRDFWEYHARRLHELGFRLDRGRLFAGVILKLFDLILSPKETVRLLIARMRIRRALRS